MLRTGKHGKTGRRDEVVDDVAEEVELPAVLLDCRVEIVDALALYDSGADPSEADQAKEDAAHDVGEDTRRSRIHDALEAAQPGGRAGAQEKSASLLNMFGFAYVDCIMMTGGVVRSLSVDVAITSTIQGEGDEETSSHQRIQGMSTTRPKLFPTPSPCLLHECPAPP